MARPDPIRVVEQAYRWEPDDQRWLAGMVDAARGYGVGGGAVACAIDLAVRPRVTALAHDEQTDPRFTTALHAAITGFPLALARNVFSPTEFVGNSVHRLHRLAGARDEVAAHARRHGPAAPALWAVISGDPRRSAVMLCFPATAAPDPDSAFPHHDARSLGLVGAHLGAALRLRGLVGAALGDTTEAVLEPSGKVVHASGAARHRDARGSLVAAVVASERARGRLRREAPDAALAAWGALIGGRWTILDSIDSDGRRYVLARRNPLHQIGLLDLTPDERDVAWLAAIGHSYKYIAYELGLPLSTVSGRLRRAMRKLRVGSRAELLQRIGVTEHN